MKTSTSRIRFYAGIAGLAVVLIPYGGYKAYSNYVSMGSEVESATHSQDKTLSKSDADKLSVGIKKLSKIVDDSNNALSKNRGSNSVARVSLEKKVSEAKAFIKGTENYLKNGVDDGGTKKILLGLDKARDDLKTAEQNFLKNLSMSRPNNPTENPEKAVDKTFEEVKALKAETDRLKEERLAREESEKTLLEEKRARMEESKRAKEESFREAIVLISDSKKCDDCSIKAMSFGEVKKIGSGLYVEVGETKIVLGKTYVITGDYSIRIIATSKLSSYSGGSLLPNEVVLNSDNGTYRAVIVAE